MGWLWCSVDQTAGIRQRSCHGPGRRAMPWSGERGRGWGGHTGDMERVVCERNPLRWNSGNMAIDGIWGQRGNGVSKMMPGVLAGVTRWLDGRSIPWARKHRGMWASITYGKFFCSLNFQRATVVYSTFQYSAKCYNRRGCTCICMSFFYMYQIYRARNSRRKLYAAR